MRRSVARGFLAACVVVLPLCAPTASSACECLDRLWNWCRGVRSETTYAPPFAPAATVAPVVAPACSPVACNPCASQTCSYVPHTCYRTVLSTVPVTSCQTVTSCDPCSGCPVTCYRPVTVYQTCAQLIPYTTYRAVWSNPCVASYAAPAAPCGVGCATTYAPSVSYGAPALSTGSSCCGARVPVGSSAPLLPTPDANSSSPPPITFAPTQGAAPGGTVTSPQVQKQNMPIDNPDAAPKPVDDNVRQNSLQKPSLDAPLNSADRTALRAIRRVQYVSDVRVQRPAPSGSGPIDFGGWQPASD